MDDNYDITFLDYKKSNSAYSSIWDYMRDIVKKHDGKLIQGSDYFCGSHIEDDYVELTEIDLRD